MRPLACLSLAAALFAGRAVGAEGAGGGTLFWARGADAQKLDPADISDAESAQVCAQIYETLVRFRAEDCGVEPGLATKWVPSDGGRTWTFELRPGVKFHDGTDLDAGAVAKSLTRLVDAKDPTRFGGAFPYAPLYQEIERVEADGTSRVRFRLKRPYAPFLVNLAMFPAGIVSPAALSKHGERFGENPVGTGPFRLARWRRGEELVLEANGAYWGEKPRLARAVFRPIPENATRYLALTQGEVQVAEGLNPEDIGRARGEAGLAVLEAPGMNVAYLALNTSKSPLDRVEVRRAIAKSLGAGEWLDAVYGGLASPAAHPLPPGLLGYDGKTPPWEDDLDGARADLRAAAIPEGFEIELWHMTSPRPYLPKPDKAALAIQASLARVGIRARLRGLEWGDYLGRLMRGEHAMALIGWIGDTGDTDNFLYTLLHSDNAAPGSAQNFSFCKDGVLDRLLKDAQGELDDGKRAALYGQALARIREQVPLVPFAHAKQILVASKRVEGIRLHPTGIYPLAPAGLKE